MNFVDETNTFFILEISAYLQLFCTKLTNKRQLTLTFVFPLILLIYPMLLMYGKDFGFGLKMTQEKRGQRLG